MNFSVRQKIHTLEKELYEGEVQDYLGICNREHSSVDQILGTTIFLVVVLRSFLLRP